MPCATVADDWEDWEDETFQPKLEATTNGQTSLTKGQAAPAAAKEPDEAKFAGEDEEDSAPPAWEKSVPKPQQVLILKLHLLQGYPLRPWLATAPMSLHARSKCKGHGRHMNKGTQAAHNTLSHLTLLAEEGGPQEELRGQGYSSPR